MASCLLEFSDVGRLQGIRLMIKSGLLCAGFGFSFPATDPAADAQRFRQAACDRKISRCLSLLRCVRPLGFVAVILYCGFVSGDGQTRKTEQLFKRNDFSKNWTFHCAEKGTERNQFLKWVDKDAVLVCFGKPFGYIRTVKSYDNFELSLE